MGEVYDTDKNNINILLSIKNKVLEIENNIKELDKIQEDIIDEDITHKDIKELDKIEEDITEKDVIDEDITHEDITEKDITEKNITEKDVIDEDITDEDITDEDVIEKDIKVIKRISKRISNKRLKALAKSPVVIIKPVTNNKSSFNLPSDWNLITKKRKCGITKGRIDKYWISPEGVKYNSMLKVKIELEKEEKKRLNNNIIE